MPALDGRAITWLVFPATAAFFGAQFAIVLRLRLLARTGGLPPDARAYFAPLIKDPLVAIVVGWDSLGQQAKRMREGRVLALLLTGRHRQVADPWVTGVVYAQRIIVGLWIAVGLGLLLRR
jgi:hypothetical protein